MDHRPAAGGNHRRQRLAGEQVRCLEVQLQHPLKLILVTPVDQVGGLHGAAGVVDKDAEVAKLLNGGVDEVTDSVGVGHVTLDRNDTPVMFSPEFVRDGRDILVRSRADDHFSTRLGERPRDLSPDATRGSSDYCRTVRE